MVEPINNGDTYQITDSPSTGFIVIAETETGTEIDKANANLIAAAPELLAALVELWRLSGTLEVLGEWEALDINPSMRKKNRDLVTVVSSKVKAVIAKAEGRA
jgi:hypothetical protein